MQFIETFIEKPEDINDPILKVKIGLSILRRFCQSQFSSEIKRGWILFLLYGPLLLHLNAIKKVGNKIF